MLMLLEHEFRELNQKRDKLRADIMAYDKQVRGVDGKGQPTAEAVTKARAMRGDLEELNEKIIEGTKLQRAMDLAAQDIPMPGDSSGEDENPLVAQLYRALYPAASSRQEVAEVLRGVPSGFMQAATTDTRVTARSFRAKRAGGLTPPISDPYQPFEDQHRHSGEIFRVNLRPQGNLIPHVQNVPESNGQATIEDTWRDRKVEFHDVAKNVEFNPYQDTDNLFKDRKAKYAMGKYTLKVKLSAERLRWENRRNWMAEVEYEAGMEDNLKLNAWILQGTGGNDHPYGLFTGTPNALASSPAFTPSLVADNTWHWKNIEEVISNLHPMYANNASWVINRNQLIDIQTQEDKNGHPIWISPQSRADVGRLRDYPLHMHVFATGGKFAGEACGAFVNLDYYRLRRLDHMIIQVDATSSEVIRENSVNMFFTGYAGGEMKDPRAGFVIEHPAGMPAPPPA